jgi:hypothetical protein
MCQIPLGYSRPSSPSCLTSKGKSTAHKLVYVTQKGGSTTCSMFQDRHMTCQAYLEKFQNSVKVIEHCGRDLGIDNGLIDATFATANPAVRRRDTAAPETVEAAKKYAREQYLACAFLLGSDRKRYGKLLENLKNDYTQQKNDKWPKTITDAYSLLINWKQDPRILLQVVRASSDGVAFTNIGEKVTEKRVTSSTPATTAGNEKEKVWVQPPPIHTAKCYKCNKKMGHYSNECPTKTAVQLLMAGVESNPLMTTNTMPRAPSSSCTFQVKDE